MSPNSSVGAAICLVFAAGICPAQLTTDQRLADFRNLADTFAKKYAFYEWKRDAVKFDALDLGPWLSRVSRAKDDLEFYDLMVEYVASLNDAHDNYFLPSTFRASLGFSADIYEGKLLVDSIDRARLPTADFPFEAGDELVSVDGKTADEWLQVLVRYSTAANTRSTRRVAAARITSRGQDTMPRAHDVGDTAEVKLLRKNGETATYTILWRKTGVPVTVLSPAPPVKLQARARSLSGYPRILPRVRNWALPAPPEVVGIQAKNPVFSMPEWFQQRLTQTDPIFSGLLTVDTVKIGFIRIPSFQLSFRADDLIKREIAFYKDNSDGLIIDVMRNPGGSPCQAEELLSHLMPNPFQVMGQEIRVNWTDELELTQEIDLARRFGASDEEIAVLEMYLQAVQKALRENQPRTEPLPICGGSLERQPATDRAGVNIAYSKPVMVLIDEFSASAAEVFAAVFQDNGRGKLAGWRTMGAGGGVAGDTPAGVYSEGSVSVTITAGNRKQPVVTPDYPTSAYIENIGVRPDTELDYMTKDNLLNKGQAFVQAFTAALVEIVKAGQ